MEIWNATNDMNRHYWDMKQDNTKYAYDYFHCKASYDATKRGMCGGFAAQYLGDVKEDFDYYYNQLLKGLTQEEAQKDLEHDKQVNQIGRQRAARDLYSDAIEACQSFRVKGINEKY